MIRLVCAEMTMKCPIHFPPWWHISEGVVPALQPTNRHVFNYLPQAIKMQVRAETPVFVFTAVANSRLYRSLGVMSRGRLTNARQITVQYVGDRCAASPRS